MTSSLFVLTFVILMVQFGNIQSQSTNPSAALSSLPSTVNILLSISAATATGDNIDDRTAEDIRTAFTSPSVSILLNSTTSTTPVSQYFFSDDNSTQDPIQQLQAINSLYVIKVMFDIANKVAALNDSNAYSRFNLMYTPMQRTLRNFFNGSSAFPQAETAPTSDSSSPSLSIFVFTPVVISALDVTLSFSIENNPLLANLTIDQSADNITLNALFELARLVHVARQVSALINITSDANTIQMLQDNLRSFQRILYTINSLTNYQLVDQITELDFLSLISPPNVEVTPVKKRNEKQQTKTKNIRAKNIRKRNQKKKP